MHHDVKVLSKDCSLTNLPGPWTMAWILDSYTFVSDQQLPWFVSDLRPAWFGFLILEKYMWGTDAHEKMPKQSTKDCTHCTHCNSLSPLQSIYKYIEMTNTLISASFVIISKWIKFNISYARLWYVYHVLRPKHVVQGCTTQCATGVIRWDPANFLKFR